jgi:hypothetical protein
MYTPPKETVMSIEEQAMNDAMQNKGMANDSNWTYQERQKYMDAYAGAKQKMAEQTS